MRKPILMLAVAMLMATTTLTLADPALADKPPWAGEPRDRSCDPNSPKCPSKPLILSATIGLDYSPIDAAHDDDVYFLQLSSAANFALEAFRFSVMDPSGRSLSDLECARHIVCRLEKRVLTVIIYDVPWVEPSYLEYPLTITSTGGTIDLDRSLDIVLEKTDSTPECGGGDPCTFPNP